MSSGNIIAFIDGDARANKSWLNNLIKPFEENSPVHIVSGKVNNLNKGSFFSEIIFRSHYKAAIEIRSSKLIGANMAFRKTVFNSVLFFDTFKNYGDETSVALAYFKKYPTHIECYASAAIVFNEHPNQYIDWLLVRYRQGKALSLISKYFKKNSSLFTFFFKFLPKIILLLSIILLLITLAIIQNINGLILLLLIILGLNITRFKYYSAAFSNVKKKMGLIKGVISLGICFTGNILADLGYVLESIVLLFKGKIETNNYESKVLETIES